MRNFVGDASHELRTPLVSVRGYAELYRMGALTSPEEVAQAMERIEKDPLSLDRECDWVIKHRLVGGGRVAVDRGGCVARAPEPCAINIRVCP